LASTLLDALDQLGAVAEVDSMHWHGAVLSLSRHETEWYDALADDSGLYRTQVIRQLAVEGLLARQETDARSSTSE